MMIHTEWFGRWEDVDYINYYVYIYFFKLQISDDRIQLIDELGI